MLRVVHLLLALLLSPLMIGVINRVKARFAGRVGPPLAQPYWDLAKLLRKGAVYSRTTTWLFRAGPIVSLAGLLVALTLVPLGPLPAAFSFAGDFLALASLLALGRFVTVLAALDTGSAFEGMGASREVQFSALAEPALLLGLVSVARWAGPVSLAAIARRVDFAMWLEIGPPLALIALALLVVMLAENARIPVDDPNTHLELTMIHEVMVLDHGGPDLAMILYGQCLKLWILGALLVGLLPLGALGAAVPLPAPLVALAGGLLAMLALAVLVGVIESSIARLRMTRVPSMLVGAGALSALALLLVVSEVRP